MLHDHFLHGMKFLSLQFLYCYDLTISNYNSFSSEGRKCTLIPIGMILLGVIQKFYQVDVDGPSASGKDR